MENPSSTEYKMVVHELLAFIVYFCQKIPVDILRRCVLKDFKCYKILEVKIILLEKFGQLIAGSLPSITRRNSSSRAAHEAELQDIFSLRNSVISTHNTAVIVGFVAADLDKICRYFVDKFTPSWI